MTTLYIISQVLAFIGFGLELVGRLMKGKKHLLIFSISASLFCISSYIFLGAILPAIVNGINLLRNLVYVIINKKNLHFKYYILPMIITILSTTVAVAILWNGPMDLFMIASLTILAIGLAFKNMLNVRLCLITNSILWCIYNFTLKAYVNMSCDIVQIIIVIVALITYNVILPKRKKEDKSV